MTEALENVSVVGLGKLGLCLAAVLAEAGFHTVGVDINERAVDAINRGESPIIEPGLSELIARHGGKNLVATTRHSEAIEGSDITFILVATPSYADGRFSNEFAEAALRGLAESLAKSNKPFHTFVVSCTVMAGSTDQIFVPLIEKHSGRKLNEGFGVCYDPEFVALGTVIRNFQKPDVVVIGETAGHVGDRVESVHRKLCQNTPPVFRMSTISAEVAKISLNVFLTTKISFGNMLANLCEKIPGADVDQITKAIGTDKRIAPYYLRGGLAFGGPCFPRDTRAFLAMAKQYNYEPDLIRATDSINERQTSLLLDKVLEATEGKRGTRVGVLGLAFKSDTPVIMESPAVRLIEQLLERGHSVVAYDALAVPSARAVLGDRIEYAGSASECIRATPVCVVANMDNEYKLAAESCQPGEQKTLIDCWRILEPGRLPSSISYVALGRASKAGEATQAAIPRVNVLGVGVSAVNMKTTLGQIERWIERREQNYVVCAPAHGLMDCHRDEKLRRIYNRAGLVIPDGMPVAWVCRMMGYKGVERVCGADLMYALCQRSVGPGYRHFLYGGWPPEIVEKLAARLREQFPGIQIAGSYAPPFRPLTPEEDEEIIAKINAVKPDIVWIGLGTSKEKYWAASHVGKLTAPILVGVGAAFDFHSATKQRAPLWMQRAGLEWFFRVVTEPRRLGPRYLKDNPAFLFLILRQFMGRTSTAL
jgi:UDPglucose 6-dehydrogenase